MCTSFQAMLLFYALFSYVVSLHFRTGMSKFADVDHLLSTWEIAARDISFTFKCMALGKHFHHEYISKDLFSILHLF